MNILSRKNEYEADRFAAENYKPKALASALKKLSVNNLSNLTPHKWYVFFSLFTSNTAATTESFKNSLKNKHKPVLLMH